MKRIITLLAIVFMSHNMWAQKEIEIGWLTTEVNPESVGYPSDTIPYTVQLMMEFTSVDLLNYKISGEKINAIKQVQYYLDKDRYGEIIDFKVVLMQGDDANTATVVKSQSVDKEELSAGWVEINLDEEYAVDYTKSLFIGCQITYPDGGDFPLNVVAVKEANPKQGWYKRIVESVATEFYNLSSLKKDFLMKAIANVGDAYKTEIYLESVDVKDKTVLGDINISGVVKNLGLDTITSFILHYEVDGKVGGIDTISEIKIASGKTYTFTSSHQYTIKEAKNHNVKVVVSEPNMENDFEANNFKETSVQGYLENIPMVVLHEAFSSSTCYYCKDGNTVLKSVLKAVDTSKWVCIKYQCAGPSTGDPYYTEEVGVRYAYYQITGIPAIVAGGTNGYNGDPRSYTSTRLNVLNQRLSAGKINATAKIEDKTVSFSASMTPVTTIKDTALRFFAAIVEKRTEKNVKTNGETEFQYVMKKFMTDVNGEPIDSLKTGETRNFNYTYTFKGDYRLPVNAGSPINHAIENSVENFDYLMVVCWIQNMRTGEVFQAGKGDPNPHLLKIDKINENEVSMNVYPNPSKGDVVSVNFELKDPIKGQLSLYDMVGKEVLRLPESTYYSGQKSSLDISNLSSGVYFIRLNTDGGSTAKKLIITK